MKILIIKRCVYIYIYTVWIKKRESLQTVWFSSLFSTASPTGSVCGLNPSQCEMQPCQSVSGHRRAVSPQAQQQIPEAFFQYASLQLVSLFSEFRKPVTLLNIIECFVVVLQRARQNLRHCHVPSHQGQVGPYGLKKGRKCGPPVCLSGVSVVAPPGLATLA